VGFGIEVVGGGDGGKDVGNGVGVEEDGAEDGAFGVEIVGGEVV